MMTSRISSYEQLMTQYDALWCNITQYDLTFVITAIPYFQNLKLKTYRSEWRDQLITNS